MEDEYEKAIDLMEAAMKKMIESMRELIRSEAFKALSKSDKEIFFSVKLQQLQKQAEAGVA